MVKGEGTAHGEHNCSHGDVSVGPEEQLVAEEGEEEAEVKALVEHIRRSLRSAKGAAVDPRSTLTNRYVGRPRQM